MDKQAFFYRVGGLSIRLSKLEFLEFAIWCLAFSSRIAFDPPCPPFLTQSDSVSPKRKRPISTGRFFDWTVLVLLIVSRSRFHSFCALPRGGRCEGVLLYGSRKSVGSSVLRAFSASNACCPCDKLPSTHVGGVELSQKPPKLPSWRCTQPRAAKDAAGVAVVGKMASRPRAAAVV